MCAAFIQVIMEVENIFCSTFFLNQKQFLLSDGSFNFWYCPDDTFAIQLTLAFCQQLHSSQIKDTPSSLRRILKILDFRVWYDNNEDDFICEKQWQRTNEDWFHKYSCRSSRASEIFLPASHGHVCDCGASQSAGRRGPSLRVFSPLSSNDW